MKARLTLYTPVTSGWTRDDDASRYAARISLLSLLDITISHRDLTSLARGSYASLADDDAGPEVVVLDGHGFWLEQDRSPFRLGVTATAASAVAPLIAGLPGKPSAVVLAGCHGGQWDVRRDLAQALRARFGEEVRVPVLAARAATWGWQALWLYPTLAWRLSTLTQSPSCTDEWACLLDWALLDAAALSIRGDLARRQGHRSALLPGATFPASAPGLFDDSSTTVKRASRDQRATLRELAQRRTARTSQVQRATMWAAWSVST